MGINLDTLQSDGPKLETVMPNIRRFLLDHNVRWPNLINGTGTNDYAKAYGVTEIPSNVLIGRDGNVIHLDLSPRKNLDAVVAEPLRPERTWVRVIRRTRRPSPSTSAAHPRSPQDAGDAGSARLRRPAPAD